MYNVIEIMLTLLLMQEHDIVTLRVIGRIDGARMHRLDKLRKRMCVRKCDDSDVVTRDVCVCRAHRNINAHYKQLPKLQPPPTRSLARSVTVHGILPVEKYAQCKHVEPYE